MLDRAQRPLFDSTGAPAFDVGIATPVSRIETPASATKLAPWERSKTWADTFSKEIQATLGRHLIGPTSIEEDRAGCDFRVYRVGEVRVGARVRSHGDLLKYGDGEFTIRCARPRSGNPTEIDKILDGAVDHLFYAFAAEIGSVLDRYVILDAAKVATIYRETRVGLDRGCRPGEYRENLDRSSDFYVFPIRPDFESAVIARDRGVYLRAHDFVARRLRAASRFVAPQGDV